MNMRLGLGLGQAPRGWRASPWTPASLFAASEEGAWYDPSDLGTVWQNDAGTVAGAIDSPVGRLDDKSGNGNHLLQATTGKRPILRSDGTLYWLERDGSDDFLASAASLTIKAGWTLGAAASFTSGSNTTSASIFGLERTGTVFFYTGVRQDITRARSLLRAASIADPVVAQTLAETATDAYPAGTPAVLVSRFQALSHDIRLNGTTRDTVATTWDGQTVSGSWLVFGRQEISPVVPMNMYAAAALKRLPSAAELANLEAWLAAKAGVTL